MASKSWKELLDESGGGEVLPVGDYDVEVADASYQKTSTDKDMYIAKFAVANGPYKGRPVYNNFVLSPENPNALRIFFRQMKVLGADSDFFETDPSHEQICDKIKGARCRITINHRDWDGAARENVTAVKPSDDDGGNEAPASTSPSPSGKPF